ncbi:MAG: hypothetical protein K8R90_11395 [Candidatus Cloacimonetes bacterium]|nr:hypothetical protein [Candidatus Cloacimonadota bacterium]
MRRHIRLDSLKRDAEVLLNKIISESERLARMGSLKLKISTLRGEINDYQSEIGAWVCEHRDALPEDADVTALLGKIDSLQVEVRQRQSEFDGIAGRGAPCENEGTDDTDKV